MKKFNPRGIKCIALFLNLTVLSACSGIYYSNPQSLNCHSKEECQQVAYASCKGAPYIRSIEDDNDGSALFGDGLSVSEAVISGALSDELDDVLNGGHLRVDFSCERPRKF